LKLPETVLPEGYSIRRGSGSERDKEDWSRITSVFRRDTLYPDGEKDLVVFLDYNGIPVGCETVIYQDDTCIMGACVFLEEHRGQGLHLPVTVERLRYCHELDVKYIRIAAREWLTDFWVQLGVSEFETG